MELTTRAAAIVEKVGRVIATLQDEFSQAHLPEPDAHRYSAVENNERRKRKMEELAKSTHTRLTNLLQDVRGGIKEEEAAVDKVIHPLATSNSTYDNEAGRYEEELAFRIVETVGVAAVESEYANAMKHNRIDLGTFLIDWCERFTDGKSPEEFRVITELKRQHVEALQLNPMLLSLAELKKQEKIVDGRLQMLAGGFITQDQAASAAGYGEMLKLQGVAFDSAQV